MPVARLRQTGHNARFRKFVISCSILCTTPVQVARMPSPLSLSERLPPHILSARSLRCTSERSYLPASLLSMCSCSPCSVFFHLPCPLSSFTMSQSRAMSVHRCCHCIAAAVSARSRSTANTSVMPCSGCVTLHLYFVSLIARSSFPHAHTGAWIL